VGLLADLWDDEGDPEAVPLLEYIHNLQERLEKQMQQAHDNLMKAQGSQQFYYNKKAKHREYKEGDQVLYLWPRKQSKFSLSWVGPATVKKKVRDCNYVIYFPEEDKERFVHINMLKPFYERPEYLCCMTTDEDPHIKQLYEDSTEVGYSYLQCKEFEEGECLPTLPDHIPGGSKEDLENLVKDFRSIFSYLPGETDLVVHSIEADDSKLSYRSPYKCAAYLREPLREELRALENAGIISKVTSRCNFAAPLIVLPKKTPGKVRIVL
jgi:hypothetical protein